MEDAGKNIAALLEKLGLTKNETACYLASLNLGPAVISELSKAARVSRVNAYSAIKKLLNRGLMEEEMNKKAKLIHPAPMERLRTLAREQQKDAARLRWKIENLLPQLAALRIKHPEQPKVLFYEENEDTWKKIHQRSLDMMTPGGEILFLGAYWSAIAGTLDAEWYIPARLKRNVTARVLNYMKPEVEHLHSRDAQEKRQTRFLPSAHAFPCAILIYGNEVSFLWDSGGGKSVGTVIQGAAIVGVMKAVFKLAWDMAGQNENNEQLL